MGHLGSSDISSQTRATLLDPARTVAIPGSGNCQSIHIKQHAQSLAQAEAVMGTKAVAAYGGADAAVRSVPSKSHFHECPAMPRSTAVS